MRNKNPLVLMLLLTVVSIQAFSQVQLALGLKGGPNFAKIDVNSNLNDNYKNRTGFHGGAFFLVKVFNIGIQPEILFSKQGANFKFNSQDYHANYDYFNVPIILKLYTVAGINLQLGPQFGFLSSIDGSTISNVNSTTQVISATKSLYKKSDLSLAMGAGWDLPFGLVVDARYNLGLSKIQDNPDLDATKNQVWQISLGYKLIKIGKKK